MARSGDYRGPAALILAVGVAATLILLAVETMTHVGAITAQESTVLSTVLGATVGAVATYMGGHALDAIAAEPLEPEPEPEPVEDGP